MSARTEVSVIVSRGRHLIAELSGCNATTLNDVDILKREVCEAVRRANGAIVATKFHRFIPIGISGVVMFTSSSHLTIHTWPEHAYAGVDLFCGGNEFAADTAVAYLVDRLAPSRVSLVEIRRGVFPLSLSVSEVPRAICAGSHED
jgi:S-adenosylmethionine decarboxylase